MQPLAIGSWLETILSIISAITIITTSTAMLAAVPVPVPDQPLVIDSDNFLTMMEALWEDTDRYLGSNVELLGFVHEDPQLAPTDFVLARLIKIGEGPADVQAAGLLCRYSEQGKPAPGQWLIVRGRLGKIPYYNAVLREVVNMPYLQVTEVISAQKPTQEYILPE